MELLLNLVWGATGLAILAAWFLLPRHEHASRRKQALCLGVAILLLLPVISLSDDLVAAQMTTEMDSCARRAQDGHAHQPHICTPTCAAPAPPVYEFQAKQGNDLLSKSTDGTPGHTGFIQLPFSRPPPMA